eukprot:TRINITY_DN5243_c0_g1_i1.p1 TRINITY_DN5243_c0_g1~~TRINITY_DN5243_c0_g1_i1.p1  ORF type:complete len:455 (+),score=66.74 TRINITY_DN5243_c0_g1_i1:184-1365(+)
MTQSGVPLGEAQRRVWQGQCQQCPREGQTLLKSASKNFGRKIYAPSDQIPANEQGGLDKDHWYVLSVEDMLPPSLRAVLQEALKGRTLGKLVTTRMPRNTEGKSDVQQDEHTDQEKFAAKVKTYGVKNVLTLVEDHEPSQKNSTNLWEFYGKLGLQVSRAPTDDFDAPAVHAFTAAVESIGLALWHGRSTLIHCMGGTGRTAVFLTGVLKYLGVFDPVSWARYTGKSTYVEVEEQEYLVSQMPFLSSSKMRAASQHGPDLLQWRISAHLHNVENPLLQGRKTKRELSPETEAELTNAFQKFQGKFGGRSLQEFLDTMSIEIPTISPMTAPGRHWYGLLEDLGELEPTPDVRSGDLMTNTYHHGFGMEPAGKPVELLWQDEEFGADKSAVTAED